VKSIPATGFIPVSEQAEKTCANCSHQRQLQFTHCIIHIMKQDWIFITCTLMGCTMEKQTSCSTC